MRLFLDANVLFTAAYSDGGRARALFRLAEAGRCALLSSIHAVTEARRNISLKAPRVVGSLEDLVAQVDNVLEADPRLLSWARDLGLPPNDAPILAAAVAGGADLLVTGDRTHFGFLFGSREGGVLVATPAEALDLVLASGRRS